MPDSYTTLWSQDRCQLIKRYRQERTRLELLFGGPHTSEPSFRRYRVKAGDYIYPVYVAKGILYVIGRMQIAHLLTLPENIDQYPHIFRGMAN